MHLINSIKKCQKGKRIGASCEYFLYESNLGCCTGAAQTSEVLEGRLNAYPGVLFTKYHWGTW